MVKRKVKRFVMQMAVASESMNDENFYKLQYRARLQETERFLQEKTNKGWCVLTQEVNSNSEEFMQVKYTTIIHAVYVGKRRVKDDIYCGRLRQNYADTHFDVMVFL